jgi:large conductance mechanosensitive channel
LLKGFKEFLFKNNVLALAIAVIVGGAVGKVVSSLAAEIIMPVVSLLLPSGEWRTARLVLSRATGPDGKEVVNALGYGSFLGNVIDFLVIAFVVYLLTRSLLKEPAAAPAAPSKQCPRCLESIAPAATRCKYCTAEV